MTAQQSRNAQGGRTKFLPSSLVPSFSILSMLLQLLSSGTAVAAPMPAPAPLGRLNEVTQLAGEATERQQLLHYLRQTLPAEFRSPPPIAPSSSVPHHHQFTPIAMIPAEGHYTPSDGPILHGHPVYRYTPPATTHAQNTGRNVAVPGAMRRLDMNNYLPNYDYAQVHPYAENQDLIGGLMAPPNTPERLYRARRNQ
ncbi:uncharacterized protein UTRI_02607 [Ustilago trichophora]|uniref:Uncharacterized protein n=1 Tax=Ustilago trichophora TaxID=86804 RepID=A0A5C3EPJ9_9BASI|nr:uncharacterized protein UTRI_02607 [Ustilago trichophora]